MSVHAFITVWILLVGKGSGAAVQVGPEYADQRSCFAVRDSLLYQRKTFKRQCVQVNIPSATSEVTLNTTIPAPIVTPIIEIDIHSGKGRD